MEQINERKPKNKKKIIFIIIAVIVFAIFVMNFVSENDSEYIDIVKNGAFDEYPDQLIGVEFEEFFSNPEWKHFVSEDDLEVVEFTGGCTYNDEPADALIQFIVDKSEETFRFSYFEINGQAQDEEMMNELMIQAFEED